MPLMLIQFDADALSAGQRKVLRDALAASAGLELKTFTARGSGRGLVSRMLAEGRGGPVLVVDDRYSLPEQASWLGQLEKQLAGEPKANRPWLVYLSSRFRAKGQRQAEAHPLIAAHIHKDAAGQWVDKVVDECSYLLAQRELVLSSAGPGISDKNHPSDKVIPVGSSQIFLRTKNELMSLIGRNPPIFLLAGPFGCGKLHILRHLWGLQNPDAPLLCVSAGAFYKELYRGKKHYRLAGGYEGIEQLNLYLESADDGLLVLQDIEKLPMTLQDELIDRLDSRYALDGQDDDRYAGALVHNSNSDEGKLNLYTTRVACMSCLSPTVLKERNLLSRKLLDKLRSNITILPSLSQRGAEDIVLLAEQFARRFRAKASVKLAVSKEASPFTNAAEKKLIQACYPHNVADLKAIVERALRRSAAPAGSIRASDLILPKASPDVDSLRLSDVVAKAQQVAIREALGRTGGSLAKAAKLLGKDRSTIHRLIHSLGITV